MKVLASVVRRALLISAPLCVAATPVVAQQGSGVAGLEEVVVTARKRSEPLQDVPVAATAFSSADFERQQVFGLEDLNLSVPNMTITRNNTGSNGAQIYIRGIGRDNSTWNEESGVAVYVDDVYLSQQVGSLLDFIEYERLEVLRGPQGTLYGRNATSGAVKFVVKRPTFDGFRAIGDVTFGSFRRLDVRGSVGEELVDDKLAVKVDFVSRSDDGYVRRPANSTFGPNERLNGTNRQTGRIAALYQMSDATEFYFAGDVTYGRDDINTPIAISDPDGDGRYTPRFGDIYRSDPGIRNDTSFRGYSLNGQFKIDFEAATLKSITAFRSIEDELRGDLDGFFAVPIDFDQTTQFDTFTQEIQFNGSIGERIDYVTGLYYFKEDLSADSINAFLGGLRTLSYQTTTSYAAYADLTFKLTDRWAASVGGRFTRDEKDVSQSAISPAGAYVFRDVAGNQTWEEFSPRVDLDFRATRDVLLYASWGRGFKAGAVANGRPPTADQANVFTAPEVATTSEVGVKSQWLDDRLRLNLAVFDTDYENQQASFRQEVTNIIRVVAADAEIQGVELEAVVRPIEPLTVYLTAGWLDSAYTDAQPGHPAFGLLDRVQLKQIPQRSYKLGVDYRIPLASLGGSVVLNANYLNSSKIPRDIYMEIGRASCRERV